MLKPSQLMDRFLLRSQSPASGTLVDTAESADTLPLVDPSLFAERPSHKPQLSDQPTAVTMVTVEVLDLKLQVLLQSLTPNIAKEVGKIAHELRGEIDQLGDHTDTLESKFDNTVQYVHVFRGRKC